MLSFVFLLGVQWRDCCPLSVFRRFLWSSKQVRKLFIDGAQIVERFKTGIMIVRRKTLPTYKFQAVSHVGRKLAPAKIPHLEILLLELDWM